MNSIKLLRNLWIFRNHWLALNTETSWLSKWYKLKLIITYQNNVAQDADQNFYNILHCRIAIWKNTATFKFPRPSNFMDVG